MSSDVSGERGRGHDVDILLSHPQGGRGEGTPPGPAAGPGQEGAGADGSSGSQHLQAGGPGGRLRAHSPSGGQMDHFEKWLGICRFEKSVTPSSGSDSASKSAEVGCSAVKKLLGTDAEESDSCTSERWRWDFQSGKDDSPVHKGGTPARNKPKPTAESTTGEEKEDDPKNLETGRVTGSPVSHSKTRVTESEAEDCEEQRVRTPSSNDGGRWQANGRLPGNWRRPSGAARARRVDLIVAPYSQYYYARWWAGRATSSSNRDLRLYAQKELGMKLTSHGLSCGTWLR